MKVTYFQPCLRIRPLQTLHFEFELCASAAEIVDAAAKIACFSATVDGLPRWAANDLCGSRAHVPDWDELPFRGP